VKGVEGKSEVFKHIWPLVEGRSIELDEMNCESVSMIGEILENEELLGLVVEFKDSLEAISVSNCISRLKAKERYGVKVEEELKFVASHFYEIDENELKDLKIDLLEAIVSHSDLRLSDEDSFLNFIWSLGEEYSAFLGYVECRFLSVSGIDKFVCKVSEENIDIDSRIWNSICRRLQCEIVDREVNCNRFAGAVFREGHPFEFVFREGEEFDGILSSLTKKCGGNVHEKGIVNITSSGDQYNKCWQLANHGWNEWWCSTNVADSWVCFDFRNAAISVKSYTLKSHGAGSDYPVHWVIEGSNDQKNWVKIDARDTQELVGKSLVKHFNCSSDHSSEFFRFIRLRQTGKNSSNHDFLMLCNIEFFGVASKLG
jgi:hypothetical protein